MKKKKIKLILLALVSFFSVLPALAFAQTSTVITISSSVPGFNPGSVASNGPGAFVANFYQFALIIAGILAFGAIVYGGVRYAVAGGNPSGQSEAKEWIKGALYGLLLLAGAYIILYTINPNLLNLNLPTLNSVAVSGVSGTSVDPCGGVCAFNTQACWATGTGQGQCVAAINGIAICGVENGTNNGDCQDPTQTCAANPTTGTRSCVPNTVANACSNSNTGGTCTDPNAKCTNVNGNWSCVSQQNTGVCRGQPAGSCVWTVLKPAPTGCTAGGTTWPDPGCNSPPSQQQCWQKNQC